MSLPTIGDFDYTLLPGNGLLSEESLELHNRTFVFWNEFWANVFKEISGEKVRKDDFHRQNIVCILTHKSEIAAVHLYSYFHLDSLAATEHSYFQANYSGVSLELLRRSGVRSVMSMEYLTLNEKYRRSKIGLPIASVVIGLGYRVLCESGCQAMIAPCRRDLKVDVRAAEYGAEPFSEEFIHHEVPVVLMMTRTDRVQEHPDPEVRSSIEELWTRKKNYFDRAPFSAGAWKKAS